MEKIGYGAVAILVISEEDSSGNRKTLLVRQPDYPTGLPFWKFPVESLEFGESFPQAALRGAQKEVGMYLRSDQLRFIASERQISKNDYRPCLCVVELSLEDFSNHSWVGDEDGHPLEVREMYLTDVPFLGKDFAWKHIRLHNLASDFLKLKVFV